MPRIWIDYCGFLVKQCRITKTRRTFDRALKALPITQHPRIWEIYLKFAREIGGETAIRLYRRYLKVSYQYISFYLICVRRSVLTRSKKKKINGYYKAVSSELITSVEMDQTYNKLKLFQLFQIEKFAYNIARISS